MTCVLYVLSLSSDGSRGISAASSHGAALALNGDENSAIGVHQVYQALGLCSLPQLLLLLHVMKVSVSRSY